MPFHPYLNFDGNCKEAFERYKEIFGGELFLMPMSEIPDGEGGSTELMAHAALMIGDALLMASDAQPGASSRPARGVYVNYGTPDVDEAHRVFEALADGGTVETPIDVAFFSPAFGICTDRFGVPWMVSADDPNAGGPREE